MDESNQKEIQDLEKKIEFLANRQNQFWEEIRTLRTRLIALKAAMDQQESTLNEKQQDVPESISTKSKELHAAANLTSGVGEKDVLKEVVAAPKTVEKSAPVSKSIPIVKKKVSKEKNDWEKFIGENLISKIGIGITVLGVGVGAKYSIENDLISPLTRIILGYLVGIALLVVGMKLKSKYEKFSAVLVSGAMAVLFFITYAGYSFYSLFPQAFAFGLMVVFTAFTVLAALKYNQQVIALIGLVGAYAVPFLLSDGSGKVVVLFTYVAIVNTGILVVAFKKYWKPLYYVSFVLTWLLFLGWTVIEYQNDKHFTIGLTFLFIYFVTFYLLFLSYKLIKKELFVKSDVVLVLLNSFLFYGLGYYMFSYNETAEHLLGLFTLGNGVLHFIFSRLIYQQKLADKNILYLVAGMVLVFLTIAIPVQLDGNWVTLMWIGEAVILFWIGRIKSVAIYERIAYPLIALAFFSLVQDWEQNYYHYSVGIIASKIPFLVNIHFLSSLLFSMGLGALIYFSVKESGVELTKSQQNVRKVITTAFTAVFLFTTYFSLHIEIGNYWSQLFQDSALELPSESGTYTQRIYNWSLKEFGTVWLLNYTLVFLSVLGVINGKWIKNKTLYDFSLVINIIGMAAFLVMGLYALSELRDRYLMQENSEYYSIGNWNLNIRYLSFGLIALLLLVTRSIAKKSTTSLQAKGLFDAVFHITLLWILSSELIHWMDIVDYQQSYKLGLSILWGVYALTAVILGIIAGKKHLRIGAMILFAITLIKLFLYDISHLDTIAKTIVFVSLGVLLLIISFLYTKYKHLITNED